METKIEAKQVIVFRKDLLKGDNAIGKGKFAAQCCHASLGALLKSFTKIECKYPKYENAITTRYEIEFGPDCVMDSWLNHKFTKIIVGAENENELLDIMDKCDELDIPCALITESKLNKTDTEPTVTCLGIGPWEVNKLDEITGYLPLIG